MRKRATKRLLPIVLSALVAVPALEAAAYWCDWANAECIEWEYPGWSKVKECVKWRVFCYG